MIWNNGWTHKHAPAPATPGNPHDGDPRHPDHAKPYVQDYIEEFGIRKVEGDALVTRVKAGRGLCRQAILKYVDEDAYELYRAKLEPLRDQVREELDRLLARRAERPERNDPRVPDEERPDDRREVDVRRRGREKDQFARGIRGR